MKYRTPGGFEYSTPDESNKAQLMPSTTHSNEALVGGLALRHEIALQMLEDERDQAIRRYRMNEENADELWHRVQALEDTTDNLINSLRNALMEKLDRDKAAKAPYDQDQIMTEAGTIMEVPAP